MRMLAHNIMEKADDILFQFKRSEKSYLIAYTNTNVTNYIKQKDPKYKGDYSNLYFWEGWMLLDLQMNLRYHLL